MRLRPPEDGPSLEIVVLARLETPDGPLAIIQAVQHAMVRLPSCAAGAQPGDRFYGYLAEYSAEVTP